MKTPMQPKPARITCEDIGDLARQGVERALAARQATIELSPEQVAAVGGGLAFVPPVLTPPALIRPSITAGMWPVDSAGKTLTLAPQLG